MAAPYENERHMDDDNDRRIEDGNEERRGAADGDANEQDGSAAHVERETRLSEDKELAMFIRSQMDEDEGCVVDIERLDEVSELLYIVSI